MWNEWELTEGNPTDTGDVAEALRLRRLKRNLAIRYQVHHSIRSFFHGLGFLEVDTPLLTPEIAPEAEITPYSCKGWYLITSPELCLKRLVAAGYDRIFQLGHVFRQGEYGRLHNPEFSLLEWYRTGASYGDTIKDIEEIILSVAHDLGHGSSLYYQGKTIELSPPWPRISLRQAFQRLAGWDPTAECDPDRFNDDLANLIIPGIDRTRPAVLLDYPRHQASLAKLKDDDPQIAERAEVIIDGLEVANAYSELTDPIEQRERFQLEIRPLISRGVDIKLPDHFLSALEHLPTCSGAALGVDRLVMLFSDATSIEEVMPFTLTNL